MSGGAVDWNWFFSSVAQSVAALVGIFAAFIITKIVNNQSEFQRKNTRLRELLSVSAKYRDALLDRSFDWYNKRRLEYALQNIEWTALNEDFKTPEEYYGEINFPQYLPRSEVLKKIEEKVAEEWAERNAPPRDRNYSSYLLRPTNVFNAEMEQQIRESVKEEGERIRALVLEVRQHTRLVKLHLAELEGNPESSTLISSSIIGAALLFLLGVIYPLSFLPVPIDQPITYSVRAFLPILFSVRGFLLTSITVIFLAIMITFWRVNVFLKYTPQELERLRTAETLENYSDYLRIMRQNEQAQRNWSDAKSNNNKTS
jgi:hypothetical protein